MCEQGLEHVQQGYQFCLIPSADNRLIFETEESQMFGGDVANPNRVLGQGHSEAMLKDAKDDDSKHVRPVVSSWRVYHFHDTSDTAKVKRIHPVNDNLRLKSDAANGCCNRGSHKCQSAFLKNGALPIPDQEI